MKHIDLSLDGQGFRYCLLLTVAFAFRVRRPRRRLRSGATPPLDEPHDSPRRGILNYPVTAGPLLMRAGDHRRPVELPALEPHFAPGSRPAALRPLYDAGARMVTRDFFMVDRVLVNEFTAQCGLGCPDALSDGDVGLDSWRIELDDSGHQSA